MIKVAIKAMIKKFKTRVLIKQSGQVSLFVYFYILHYQPLFKIEPNFNISSNVGP